MNNRLALIACCIAGATGTVEVANATIVTLVGTDFNVVYDDTKLGQFGAPTLVGDNLFFTPNNFRAESTNGGGVVTDNSTLNGLYLVAHPGYHFGTLSLAEFGDYIMSGASSTVSVNGQLRAFDYSNSVLTQTTDNISVNGSTPLNVIDGASHNWDASAAIDNSTPTVIPGSNPWLASSSEVGLTLENNLSAYNSSTDTGPLRAMVEKKFNGVEVMVQPVPLPAAVWLLGSGFGLLVGLGRRAKTRVIS